MKKHYTICIWFCILSWQLLFAQVSVRDSSIRMFWLNVDYGGYAPGGDLDERFGFTSQIGASLGRKWKNNLYLTLGAQFLFGETVKERDLFRNVVSSYGVFVDESGREWTVDLSQRGVVIPVRFGYIWNKIRSSSMNPNCGLFVEVGGQYLMHFIYVEAPRDVPMVSKNYLKGYDRLTDGLGISQSIGYRYFSNNRLVNFAISLDLQQNFTQSRRSFDFNTKVADTKSRLDLLYGIRFTWTVPIYKRAPETFYYY
ncbi:MAG: hypothetical protein NZ108_00255 [Bacteroidia bacterium]|nr:hypothetical protein [Bacteroidia bacterium]